MKRKLNIWVVRMLAGNPFDNDSDERSVMLAEYLARQGHMVTYWGTTFNHVTKQHEFTKSVFKKVRENEDAVMLHVPIVYKKNISIQRLLYTWEQAWLLKRRIKKADMILPDVIIAACPTVESCRVLEQFGRKQGVPIIVDQRDRWPDIFENAIPKKLKLLTPIILLPLKRAARRMYIKADAICAMSPKELKFALDYAGRSKSPLDSYIFIGRKKHIPEESARKHILDYFAEKGITKDTWNICLFSSLSKMALDGDTLIEGVKTVHASYPDIRLVIGGRGDDEKRLGEKLRDCSFIQLCGYLNNDEMATVMSISKLGIMPYKNASMKDAWGNKVGQYLSYGLPVLTSTKGIAKEYFEKYSCGASYKEGDANDLATLLKELIDDENRLNELSNNAKKRFEIDFDNAIVMEKYETVIRNVYDAYFLKMNK